jgi:uncharacterized damage-inducible protein DinB
MKRPSQNEYPVHYYSYVELVKGGHFFELWDQNTREIVELFRSIDEDKHNYRYAENKWTIKDVLMHLVDTERAYSYRAFVCVRGDLQTPLYPVDENLFAANVSTLNRTMESLIEEFELVRKSFRMLFEHTSEKEQRLAGNGTNGRITAGALGYITIGHALHHKNVIKERYL